MIDKNLINLEEDMAHMKHTKYWNPGLKKDYATKSAQLLKEKDRLKKIVFRTKPLAPQQLGPLKDQLQATVMLIKSAADFIKEHKSLLSTAATVKADDD